MTRSYKAAHKESLLIISNLLPIDLIAFEFSALRYFAYKNLEFSISSAKAIEFTFSDCGLVNMSTTESLRVFRSRTSPPWMASAITYQDSTTAAEIEVLKKKSNTLNILASTSTKENVVMARIICCSSSSFVCNSQEVVLPMLTSSTQAEIGNGQLQLAVSYAVLNKSQHETCNIFSFSKPALNRATTFNKVSPPASVTREKLLENTSFISLHWLKSSDTSSTLCDQNVRIVTSDISLTETNMSPAFLQHTVRKKKQKNFGRRNGRRMKKAPSQENSSLLQKMHHFLKEFTLVIKQLSY